MRNEPTAPTHVTPPPAEETHLIHEEEPTILARWLKQGMEQGPAFWGVVAVGVIAIFGLLLLVNYLTVPDSKELEAWSELTAVGRQDAAASLFGPTPTSEAPQRLEELAQTYANTPAAGWARVQAASILLSEASAALSTTRRADGIGKLLEADELFQQTASTAKDPALRRLASFGAARAAEAKLGLPLEDAKRPKPADVIAKYEEIARQFPGTPEADEAARLASRLTDPINVEFYEQLAKFNPDDVAIPPPGTPAGGTSLPGISSPLSPGQSNPLMDLMRPGIPGGGSRPPSPADVLPPALTPPASEPPAPPREPAEAPASTPKADSLPAPSPETTPEIPGDPFPTPTPGAEAPRSPAEELPASPFPGR